MPSKLFTEGGFEREDDINYELLATALECELKEMEERASEIRKNGIGDPKYEILYQFMEKVKKMGFVKAYASLADYEKHAIVTRLENQSIAGTRRLPYEVVEKFRQELYGLDSCEGEDGTPMINHEKQLELGQILRDMWEKKRPKDK